ncbi:MAG: diphthine--ammonia ligase [Candidatus Nanohaloarchaea archaeon]
MQRAAVAWSGGKDSAFALYRARQRDDITVDSLFTTVSAEYDRVSIHGVRRELLQQQADMLGLPLETVELPPQYSIGDYNRRMVEHLRQAGNVIDAVVYADIFLEDVRQDREETLQEAGLNGVWPLWGEDTTALAHAVIDEGFEACIVCVDADRLDASFAGRWYDKALLAELPDGVDPCGETGAFHTFVTDGPVLDAAVPVTPVDTVTRETDGGEHHYARLAERGEEQ